MTSLHFFQSKGPAIAKTCSVTFSGRLVTIHSIWTGNSACYRCKSADEARIIRAILERAGVVIFETDDVS